VDAIRSGQNTFVAAGGPDAYFGFPAEATAEEGRAIVDTLGSILAEAVIEAMREGGADL
jgi:creatinine amidohydrolase